MSVLRTEREDRAIIRAWWEAEERGDTREANRLIRVINDVCLCGGPALPDSMQAAVDKAREEKCAKDIRPRKRRAPTPDGADR